MPTLKCWTLILPTDVEFRTEPRQNRSFLITPILRLTPPCNLTTRNGSGAWPLSNPSSGQPCGTLSQSDGEALAQVDAAERRTRWRQHALLHVATPGYRFGEDSSTTELRTILNVNGATPPKTKPQPLQRYSIRCRGGDILTSEGTLRVDRGAR